MGLFLCKLLYNMKRNILTIISILAILFPIYILTNSLFFSEDDKKEENENTLNESKSITCSEIKIDEFKTNIDFSGKVISANKIPISSEVNGVFSPNKNVFKVGQKFKKGDILISLDCSDLEFQLKSNKIEFKQLLLQVLPDLKSDFPSSYNEWLNYVNNFTIDGALIQHPESESEKQSNFLASRKVLSSFVQLQRIQNQLDKSIIRAPFDGVVTQSFINSGMNIVPYQKLGEFMDYSNYEIITSFSLEESKFLNIGDYATIYSESQFGTIKNDITIELVRKGNFVNPLTQGIDVIFKVKNESLLDGMYVNGSINVITDMMVSKIHKEKLIDKKYVFINRDNQINKKEINIIFSENDSIAITGLKSQDCLINKYENYFFDGMIIESSSIKNIPSIE